MCASVKQWQRLIAVSYTHLDVYKRQVFQLIQNTTKIVTPGGPMALTIRWVLHL